MTETSVAGDVRADLLALLRERAMLVGDFTLSSGQKSSYYLDARVVTLSAKGSLLVGRLMYDYLAGDLPQAVGGMSLGADPLVTAIGVVSALAGKPVDGLLVRSAPKGHGAGRRIEGPIRQGLRVVVVEDTLTTGASALAAVEALRAEGARVDRVVALVDRGQGGAERVRQAVLDFHALYAVDELLPVDLR